MSRSEVNQVRPRFMPDAIPALFLPQTTDPSRAFGWRRWIKRLSMRASR